MENKFQIALRDIKFTALEKRSRKQSAIISLSILAVLLIVFFFIRIPGMDPPFDMLDSGGGGEIILGNDAVGMNETYEGVKEGSPAPQPIPQVTPPAVEEESSAPDAEEAEEPDEATVEKAKETVKPKPTPPVEKPREQPKEKPRETTPIQPKPAEKPVERQVNQRTLFGKGGTGGNAESKGTGNRPGDQGDPNGSPDGGFKGSGGKGRGDGDGPGSGPGSGFGLGGGLSGRRVTQPPIIRDHTEREGKIVLNLTVNRDGEVTEARQTRGTTIDNATIISHAEEAALKMRFAPSQSGPELQTGTVTFYYKVQ